MLRILSSLFFLSIVSLQPEPHCSRFHYEEKTLEKMIKLEFFVQRMKDEFDKKLQEMKDDTFVKLENEKISASKKLKDIGDLLEQTRQEMTSTRPTVVFSAKGPIDMSLNIGQTVIYGEVTLNEGNSYDVTTGVFTAPVAGAYIFTLQFCTKSGDGIGYAIMSKGMEIKRGWLYDNGNDACYSGDAVDVLSKGDLVWIKCTGDAMLPRGENYYNTFSGVLLHH